MAVGTQIGGVYTNDQGKGLATTFPDSNLVEQAGQLKLAEEARQRADRKAGADKTAEMAPKETWHFYQEAIAQRTQDLLKEGAQIMTATGSDNLWSDPAEYAREWRAKFAAHNGAVNNIDQYQTQYENAINDIAVREDEYDPDYVNAVKLFPKTFSVDDLATGQVQFPVPKFSNPGNLFSDFFVAEGERYFNRLEPGEPPNEDEIVQLMRTYFADPSKKANLDAAKQMYTQLPSKARTYFADVARRKGFEEPWMAYAMHNFKGMGSTEDLDLTAKAISLATNAPLRTSGSSIQNEGGKTVSRKGTGFADPDYPEQAAKSFFQKNDFLLDKPSELRQLGIDLEETPDRVERRRKAEAAMVKLIRDNEPTKSQYSERQRAGGSGLGAQDKLDNFDDWRERLNDPNLDVAEEAARWLVDTRGFEGQSPISDVVVWAPDNAPRSLRIKFRDQKDADKARVAFLEERLSPSEIELSDDENRQLRLKYEEDEEALAKAQQSALADKRAEYSEYITELENQSRGNVLHVPVEDVGYEQVLKTLHDLSAEQKGSLYQTEIDGEIPYPMEEETKPAGPLKMIDN